MRLVDQILRTCSSMKRLSARVAFAFLVGAAASALILNAGSAAKADPQVVSPPRVSGPVTPGMLQGPAGLLRVTPNVTSITSTGLFQKHTNLSCSGGGCHAEIYTVPYKHRLELKHLTCASQYLNGQPVTAFFYSSEGERVDLGNILAASYPVDDNYKYWISNYNLDTGLFLVAGRTLTAYVYGYALSAELPLSATAYCDIFGTLVTLK